MARVQYADVVGLTDVDGLFNPLDNIQVSVFLPGGSDPTAVTIYNGRSASAKSNPFITAVGGSVEFWVNVGEYDVKFHDLTVPARISDHTIGFSAVSGADAGIPTAKLAVDAGIPYGSLGADVVRQDVPIGGVIDWWRPVNTVAVPTGYAICDGAVVTVANHDFGTGGSITLPDLRNAFVLGANTTIGDGTAAVAGTNGAAAAPGIRGNGGTHVKNIAHTHTVASHAHTMGHTHSIPNLSSIGAGTTAAANAGTYTLGSAAGGGAGTSIGHVHDVTVGSTSAPGTTGAASSGTNTGSATPATDSQLSATLDIRPSYVGLLKIMKIKRS